MAGFLAGTVLEVAAPTPRPPVVIAGVVTTIGVSAWLILFAISVRAFMRAGTTVTPVKPTTALVTSGPYALTRNPMYLGLALAYAALAVGLGVVWALVLLPLVVVFIHRGIITREERYLEGIFGDEYKTYRARTRRWI